MATCAVRAAVGEALGIVGTDSVVIADVLSGERSLSVVWAVAIATATMPIAKPNIPKRSQSESRRGARARVGVGTTPLYCRAGDGYPYGGAAGVGPKAAPAWVMAG